MLSKIFHFILRLLALISLLLCPYSLVAYFRRIKNTFLSYRFMLQTQTSGRMYIQSPFYTKGSRFMSFGKNFTAGPGFRIECWDEYEGIFYTPSITIGDNVSFNHNCHVGAMNKIQIGNNVLIGSHILITDHSHGKNEADELDIPPTKRKLYSKGVVIIEDDVWIGEGVVILPNVVIGRGSIIGANSVVTKDVPEHCIIGGNPAKVLKKI